MGKGTIIAIGAIIFVFIGGIVALIKWGMSTPSTPSTSGNDCNKFNDSDQIYKLAYSSSADKTPSQGAWAHGGNMNIRCYYDKDATTQVTQQDCPNYYAIGKGKVGFQCYYNKQAPPGTTGCIVDMNPKAAMNNGNTCPNDWKTSGWSV
jgi:hypothetical protein